MNGEMTKLGKYSINSSKEKRMEFVLALNKLFDVHEKGAGGASHGFVLSYFFLLQFQKYQNTSDIYMDAIRIIIQLGGDTDTNACIVGGILGALVGVQQIPPFMTGKLLDFDC